VLNRDRLARWLKFLVAISISVIFSALFLLSVDFDAVVDSLAGANYLYVPPALAFFAVSLGFRALRWRYLLEPQFVLSWRKLLPSLLVGYAGNNLLPLRAGELLRVQFLADRESVPRMPSFGTLMMERLFDGLVLASFLLWGLILAGPGTAYLGVGLILAGGTAAGFVVCTLLANNPAIAWRFAALPIPLIGQRLKEMISGLGESFFSGFAVLTDRRRFVAALLTTAIAWGLEFAMYWLISLAFDLNASLITIAFAGAAANVAMSLPGAQGGIGPFQAFATEALLEFGVVRAPAAAFSIALHLFLVLPVSLVGLVVLWRSALPVEQTAAKPIAGVLEVND
jgi:hypothetical protein